MKGTIIFLILVCAVFAYALPVAWINEIHYDNIGADRDEFVEVVVLNPENYYSDDIALYMINGSTGQAYCLNTVRDFELGERIGDYQFYTWYRRGIQNDCEGMHFVFKDTLLDILSYEGSFVGVTKPSTGLVFPDVGVCENSDSPDSCSIYLSGFKGSEWLFGKATPGERNPGQSLLENSSALVLEQYRSKIVGREVLIIWSCSNESNILSYMLYRNGRFIGKIDKKDTPGAHTYSYRDDDSTPRLNDNQYILSSLHLSGDETFLDTLKCSLPIQREIGLGKPFPNPFNPFIEIPFTLSEKEKVEINIFDLAGTCVYSYTCPQHEIGDFTIKVDMKDQSTGTYLIEFKNNDKTEVKKVMLLK